MINRPFFNKLLLWNGYHIPALAIIFVFLVLLITHAGSNSYWLDEIYSVYFRGMFYKTTSEHINTLKSLNPAMPLYEITLFNWMKLFGHHEVSTRSLSILFSAGAGFFLYLFMYRIYNKQLALLTLLLFLFSAMNIRYALETRYYSQMLFLSVLSSYTLLLYIENLRHDCSAKKMFLNGYFVLLTVVNAALLLNHLFNYLFFTAQALFFGGWLLFYGKRRPWLLKTIQWVVVYLAPFFLIIVVWPHAFINPAGHGIIYYFEKIIDNAQNVMQLLESPPMLIFLGVLVSIILTIVFLVPFIVKLFKKKTTINVALTNPKLFLMGKILTIALLLGLFFYISAFETYEILRFPFLVIINILGFSGMKAVWLLIIFLVVIFFFPVNAFFRQKHDNHYIVLRKVFLVYSILIVLFAVTLTLLIIYFYDGHAFRPRYLLFILPYLIIILSVILYQFLIQIDFALKRVFDVSATRFFVSNRLIISVLLTVFIMGPMAYKTLTTNSRSNWRGFAEQITNIVDNDTLHRYVVAESAFRRFPTLDYYLMRFSSDLRVDFMLTRNENNLLKLNSDFVPEILMDENLKKIEEHDYLVVTFLHGRKYVFENIFNVFDKKYPLKTICLDKSKRGFMIYDLRSDTKGSINSFSGKH